MDRRSLKLLAVILASFTFVVGTSTVAHAAPRDSAARKLQRDAMDNDYLAMSFEDAESKLEQAIRSCGARGCSPAVLASLYRDLGVIYIGGMNREADGRAAFVDALNTDPKIQLDEDLTTPEIQQAFDEARDEAGVSESRRPSRGTGARATVEGDLFHTPAAEQAILTPVPVYVELPDDIDATRVEVRYKPFGAIEWKTLNLRRMGQGYGGEIPCRDIGTTTGDLSYYIQAIGPDRDIVGTTGSRNNPVQVPIRRELEGDPPHLPNRPPPAQCDNVADCPPGLPGCEAGPRRGDKGWGASCDTTRECEAGLVCKNGSCEVGDEEGGSSSAQLCEFDMDCPEGVSCIEGVCGGGAKKWWVSLSFQPDIAYMSGDAVCSRQSQESEGYACFRQSDGVQYRGLPKEDVANAIGGGFTLSTIRILLGIDHLLADNITAGARLGFAFNGGPETDNGISFLPLHAELRAAYWFGDKPFSKKGLRPYAFLAGGLAQVDAKIPVEVSENLDKHHQNDDDWWDYTSLYDNQDYPERQTLDAWKKMGQGFIGGGAGAMYAIEANQGLFIDAKLMIMLPTSGVVIAPEIGYKIGF